MFHSLKQIFKQLIDGQDLSGASSINADLAITALLCEVANADNTFDKDEETTVLNFLQQRLQIEPTQATALLAKAKVTIQDSASLYDFTSQLRELEQSVRFDVIQGMWEIAVADGAIDPLEDAVIRKTAELLYVDHSQFIKAKLTVLEASSGLEKED